MIKKFYIIYLLVFLGFACSNTTPQETSETTAGANENATLKQDPNTTISGTIEGGSGRALYLQYLKANGIESIDTVDIDENDTYQFDFYAAQMGFYRVALNDQNLCVLIVEPDGKMTVNADASNIYQTYQVSGSEESSRLQSLNGILGQRDSINMVLQQAQMQNDGVTFQAAMAEFEPIAQKVDTEVKAFISAKPGSLASLAALQNMNIDTDYDYYAQVVDALKGKADGLDFYEAMKTQVVQLKKLAIGSPAPEIELSQPNGENLKLSDLRGQYVLIDFWASWCGPCRRENPNVKKVYEKYHDKGFEIFGVSLDKNQKAWLTAIEQDGLTWRHVSDLQYWQSSVVPEYQIQGIPLTYLVDKEGNILAKNLRGKKLEEKLAEIFVQ